MGDRRLYEWDRDSVYCRLDMTGNGRIWTILAEGVGEYEGIPIALDVWPCAIDGPLPAGWIEERMLARFEEGA